MKQVGGYMYTLYKEYNGARYFADAYDGTDKEAIELFKEIMRL